jgi:hypothetical protein
MTTDIDIPITTDVPSSAPPSRERLVLLANESMRARRRVGAIAAVYLWHLAAGALLAAPVASVVRVTWSNHPDGDGPLFADGGLELLEMVMRPDRAGAALSSHVALISVVLWVLSVVPLSFLLFAIAHTTVDLRAPRAKQLLPRVVQTVIPMLALLGLATVVSLVLGGLGLWLGSVAMTKLEAWLGEARGDQLGVLVGLALLAPAASVGVVHDLARAAVVRFRVGPLEGARIGAKTFARHPARLLWSWLWRALAALVPALAMAFVAIRLGGRLGIVLLVLFVLHQLVVASRVALRASWLARALRAVDASYKVVSKR